MSVRVGVFLMALGCALAGAAGGAWAHQGPIEPHREWVLAAGKRVLVDVHRDPIAVLASPPPPPSSRLPADWCGTVTAADDKAHEAQHSLHKIKVIEVVPADRSPSDADRDAIQASVAFMVDKIATESGGKKSLRFDLGTACGPNYADILSLKLPKNAAAYGGAECGGNLFEDTRARLPTFDGPRNFLLYALTVDCSAIAGYAQAPGDDSPGESNDANRGNYMAVTFYAESRTPLHELGHNLGAVQHLAPHMDGTRHCWDNQDVLCYPYNNFLPQSPLRPCNYGDHGIGPFDCNQDDYFSPNPAAGSYLATHWNTFDSKFMCELATCVPAPPPASTGNPAGAPAPSAPAAPSGGEAPEEPPPPQSAPPPRPASAPAARAPTRSASKRKKAKRSTRCKRKRSAKSRRSRSRCPRRSPARRRS